jgi:hypothetical protein
LIVHRSEEGWIATGAATYQEEIFVVEVGLKKNANPIRVLRLNKDGSTTVVGTAP